MTKRNFEQIEREMDAAEDKGDKALLDALLEEWKAMLEKAGKEKYVTEYLERLK